MNAEEIASRLRQWRKSIKMTQIEFAESVGINIGIIRKCEGGKSIPGGQSLIALSKTGVNLHWLLTGIGEMTAPGESVELRPFILRLRALEEKMAVLDDERCSEILNVLSAIIQEARKIDKLEKKIIAIINKTNAEK